MLMKVPRVLSGIRTQRPSLNIARPASQACQAEARRLLRSHYEFVQDLPRLIHEGNSRLVRTDREAGVP